MGRFALLSLLAIALLGVVLAAMLERRIETRALSDATDMASLVARFGIQPQLSRLALEEGLTAETIPALDQLLAAGYTSESVRSIRVWNARSEIVYSEDHALIGRRAGDEAENVAAALAGRQAARVAMGAQEGHGDAILAYVPIRFGELHKPAGAFEIHLDYKPVAAAIARDTRRLYLALAVGLLLLWGALFRIVAGASRRLRSQATENEYQARHDLLTGLPNRRSFYERVQAEIERPGAAGASTAVMLMDLDRFKDVNDTLGHHSGDLLLQQAALRLGRAVRDGDTIARLGGDEFAVLLPGASEHDAVEVAERVRDLLHERFEIDGMMVDLEASIGIALHPGHAQDVETLIQRADVAMYTAKDGHLVHAVYSADADQFSPGRLSMVGELRQAIEGGGLVLHYQPKAELGTGKVTHVEALVRWKHPERGIVPPMEFIPLAEHTGLIKPLTEYVVDEALRQCREWEQAGLTLTVAVNLSVRNLLDEELPDQIAVRLANQGVAAERLLLEITESTIMADPARALEVLLRLSDMGVRLAIDDFGTGYSSLTYLKRLPVDELKIDRSFVANMANDEDDAMIVRSTIDLGRNLGMQIVAEGVEDEEAWNRLAALGCDFAQGYYLSRPVPADDLTRWLKGAADARAAERAAGGAARA
jgi:diguanylate cyclase (GGDEF)-like protein